MIHKKDILKIAKKVLRKQKGLRDHQLIHPAREWLIGILLGLGCFTVIAWGSVATYITYSNVTVTGTTDVEAEKVVYRAELVDAALKVFGEREKNYTELLENRVSVLPVETIPVESLSSVETPTTTPESVDILEEVLEVSEEIVAPEVTEEGISPQFSD